MKKSAPLKISRRQFLKAGALAAGGGMLSTALPPESLVFGEPLPAAQVDREVDSACQFCQVRCTTKVQVKNGRVVNVYGNPQNYWTGGAMCPKGKSLVELAYSPYRILHPLIRKGGQWEQIPYAEAVDLVARKILSIKKEFPEDHAHRVVLFEPLWGSRESETAAETALHLAGFPDFCSPGDGCVGNLSAALRLCLGSGNSPTSVDQMLQSELVLLYGANIAEMYPPYVRWLSKARKKGAKIIYLDPRHTPTTNFCDRQLMPSPGTDGALVLGIIRYLIRQDRYDKAYVAAHVNGFEELAESVEPFTLPKVDEITRIPVPDILALASDIAASRRTLAWVGGSISRYTNSINSIRAIIALQAMTNNLAGPGKGIMGMQAGKPGGGEAFEEEFRAPQLASRLSVRKVLYNMKRGRVNLLLLNSSFRRYPDTNRVRAAISKVDMIVYRGFFMDPEASLAHLIIPATMVFEEEGSQYGNQRQVVWRQKAVARPGEAVEDWRFYCDLGRKINPERFPGFNSAEAIFERFRKDDPTWKGISLTRLKKEPSGIIWPCEDPNRPPEGTLFPDNRFFTDDGRVQLSTKGLGPITWKAPKGSPQKDKSKPEKFPLIFTQGKVVHHWQHTCTNWSTLMGQFSDGSYVLAHPQSVAGLGIKDGDRVYLETPIGRITVRLRLTEGILPGIVFTPSHPVPDTPIRANAGQTINTIIPYYWDKVSAQFNGFGCRLIKSTAS